MKFWEHYNQEIINLWNLWKKYPQDLAPLLMDDYMQRDSSHSLILFVGLNPSFPESQIRKKIIKRNLDHQVFGKSYKTLESKIMDAKTYEYYNWNQISVLKKNNLDEYERRIRFLKDMYRFAYQNSPEKKMDRYFLSLEEFTNKSNRLFKKIEYDIFKWKWHHIDLFSFRMTSQNEVKKKYFIQGSVEFNPTCRDFMNAQLDLWHYLVEQLEPDVLIVINAFASRIILDRYWEDIELFDFDILSHLNNDAVENSNISEKQKKTNNGSKNYDLSSAWLKINRSKRIPIIFSGMISQSRALDVFSQHRLHKEMVDIFQNIQVHEEDLYLEHMDTNLRLTKESTGVEKKYFIFNQLRTMIKENQMDPIDEHDAIFDMEFSLKLEREEIENIIEQLKKDGLVYTPSSRTLMVVKKND